MKLPVRCCCTPTKILGYIETDSKCSLGRDRLELPQPLTHDTPHPERVVITVPVLRFSEPDLDVDPSKWKAGQPPPYRTSEAIASCNMPIEFWRSLAQFTEEKNDV